MADKETSAKVMPTEERELESEDSTKGLSIALKLIIAGVGGLASHGLLAYYLATSFVIPEYFSASSENTAVIEEPSIIQANVTPTATSSQDTEISDPEITSKNLFVSVKHIVVNPYGTNGRRFLAMDMSLGVSSRSVIGELDDKDAQLRDKINTFLSRKTVAELTNIVSKRKIKKDLMILLNGMLERGKVNKIYFTKYVLQ